MLSVHNQLPTDVEIRDLGITIPANSVYDLYTRNRDAVARSNHLINALIDGSIKLVRDEKSTPYTYIDTAQAIRNITGAQTGLKLNDDGELEVNMGSKVSEVGPRKLWVHNSPKPEIPGKQFFVYYTGAGDDAVNGKIGDGDLLTFDFQPGITELEHIVEFHNSGEDSGDVYVHEAYAAWTGAKLGNFFSVCIFAKATDLQTIVNKDLILHPFRDGSGNFIKYSPNGPGTGTHGFAGVPVLIKQHLSDGDWDYSSATGLTPNFEGTGGFKIADVDFKANEFINRIPLLGDSNGYCRFESDDTAWVPPGYYMRVSVHNVSNTSWQMALAMTTFREYTVNFKRPV